MSDKQINIAIAEACGWKWSGHPDQLAATKGWEFGYQFVIRPDGQLVTHNSLPDYCNNLNAMHEAEETLDLQKAGVFAEQLRVTVYRTTRLPHVDSGSFAHVHATASQRAEAFLRTIGKWGGGE